MHERRSAAFESTEMIAIYEWPAPQESLLPTIYPGALRIPARIGECAGEVLARIPFSLRTFIFHIDLTDSSRIPLDRQGLIDSLRARRVEVVNGGLTNISKRRIQALCKALSLPGTSAGQEGDPTERLIVKTDRNHGGLPELDLQPADAELLGLHRSPAVRSSLDYSIPSRCEVPAAVWDDPRLVVERYISNAHNRCFRAFVNRDRMVISVGLDPEPIKRLPWGTPRLNCYFSGGHRVKVTTPRYSNRRLRVPLQLQQQIERFCRGLGLEFGAIDIAVDDQGTHFIVDANGTPGWGRPDLREIADFLSFGAKSSEDTHSPALPVDRI